MQLITQEDNHDDCQEHKRTTMATMMARRSTTKNTRRWLGPQWWLGGVQPRTREEDQGDGQEEATRNIRGGPRQWLGRGNREYKRRTMAMTMTRRSTTKNTIGQGRPWRWLEGVQLGTQEDKDNHGDGHEEATRNTKGRPQPWQWLGGVQPRTQEDDHSNGKEKRN